MQKTKNTTREPSSVRQLELEKNGCGKPAPAPESAPTLGDDAKGFVTGE